MMKFFPNIYSQKFIKQDWNNKETNRKSRYFHFIYQKLEVTVGTKLCPVIVKLSKIACLLIIKKQQMIIQYECKI